MIESSSYASTGKRILNFVLDFYFCFVFGFALGFITGLIGWVSPNFDKCVGDFFIYLGNRLVIGFSFLFLLVFIYFFIFELIFQKTPAKFFTKTKVVDISGVKPSKYQILKRTLIRFIPLEVFSGFFRSTKKWYGWHDRWSDTVVVDNNLEGNLMNKKQEIVVWGMGILAVFIISIFIFPIILPVLIPIFPPAAFIRLVVESIPVFILFCVLIYILKDKKK